MLNSIKHIRLSYWGIVGVLFLVGVVGEIVAKDSTPVTFVARILSYVLLLGAVIRMTRPGSAFLKLLLLVFIVVVAFSALASPTAMNL